MTRDAKKRGCFVLGAALTLVGLVPAAIGAEVIPVQSTTACAPTAVTVPVQAACPAVTTGGACGQLQTVTNQDTVYTNISNVVVPRIVPQPAVLAPIDTLKIQLYNKLNSGIITGALTNEEADEVRGQLDDVARQEAEFKLQDGCGLSLSAMNNLERKYHMVDLNLDVLANNTNTADYMPSFELRRRAMQRLIQYHAAAGNLTPAECDQLLTGLNVISDNYAAFQATGGTLTADELEQLHRDMSHLRAKLSERVGGTIAFMVPDTVFHRSQLLKHIQAGVAANVLTPDEAACLMKRYENFGLLEQSIAANDGVRSADMALLAQQILNLDSVVVREVNDRSKGIVQQSAAAGQSFHF